MANGNLDFLLSLRADTRGLDDIRSSTAQLVQSFHNATRAIADLNNSTDISAESLEQMAQHGQQAIQQMNGELQVARLELNRLSATNATPADIANAKARVRELEQNISQATTAVNGYQAAAAAAMDTPPIPTQFQRDVAQLVTSLDEARRGIDETGNSSTHTRQQLEQMAQEATQDIQRYEQELSEARLELNRLSATNASPHDIELARQRIRELETGIDQTTNSLRGLESAAARGTRELEEGADRSGSALGKVKGSVNLLQSAMAALGVGFGVSELVQIADSFQNISAQVNLVSANSKELHSALEGVRQVATQTTSSLEATANLYSRINQAGKDLGVTQQQALQITETINKSIQISGASAAASDAAITQLIQGLQSGVLRGEEFNSMMEQAPRLTTALADSLNVTKGELRAMAGEGKLTSEVVIKALKDQSDVIAQEYTKIPTTIGGALTNLKTNFTMLIGEIDSTNAASQGIVQTLLYLSENLDVLKTLFNDVALAAAYFSDRLSNTDPSTIEAVKNAVVTAYDALKTLISTIVDVGDAVSDVFLTGLDILFGWGGAVDGSTEKVSGLAVVINGLAVAIGALSDGTKAIGIGVNLLIGAFYDVAAATTYYIKMFTWGDVKEKLNKDYEELTAQRDKYYAKAKEDSLKFESDTKKALDNSVLNAEQANQKKIADNQKTLQDILTAEEKANQQLADNATKKAELEKQLIEARKSGNVEAVKEIIAKLKEIEDFSAKNDKDAIQRDKEKLESAKVLAEASMELNKGTIDDLTQEQLLRSGIIAKVDEQGKLELAINNDSKLSNEDRMKQIEALSIKEGELKAKSITAHQEASNEVEKINSSSFEAQKNYTNEQAKLSTAAAQAKKDGNFEVYSQSMLQIDQLSKAQATSDGLLTQSDLDTLRKKEEITKEKVALAQQIIDSTDGVITKEQELLFVAQGLTIEYDKQGKASVKSVQGFSGAMAALGIDVDQALNLVSAKFKETGENVDAVTVGLEGLGVTGEQAGRVTYEAWLKWLKAADSQSEVDLAEKKLKEFGDQGKLSTSQVEQGLISIRDQAKGLPSNIDPVTEAFKRLGIESKENLRLTAQQALADFNTIQASGKATAEGLKQAYERAMQAAAASGDASAIASAEAKAASLGLQVQIDKTGKASVKSMDELSSANERVKSSAEAIGDGYRTAGSIAREEAKSAQKAWLDAAQQSNQDFRDKMKRSSDEMSRLLTYESLTRADIVSQLQGKGYDQKEAEKLAGNIWSKAMEADREAKYSSFGKSGFGGSNAIYQQEFDKAFSGGRTTQSGTNKINELLQKATGKKTSIGSPTSTVNVNDLAPIVSTPTASQTASANAPSKTVKYEFMHNGKSVSLYGSQEDGNAMDDLLNQLEAIKKST